MKSNPIFVVGTMLPVLCIIDAVALEFRFVKAHENSGGSCTAPFMLEPRTSIVLLALLKLVVEDSLPAFIVLRVLLPCTPSFANTF